MLATLLLLHLWVKGIPCREVPLETRWQLFPRLPLSLLTAGKAQSHLRGQDLRGPYKGSVFGTM